MILTPLGSRVSFVVELSENDSTIDAVRTEYLGVDLTSNSRRELAVRLIAHDLQPDIFNVLADYALVVLSNSERNLHLPVRQFVLTVLGGTISEIVNLVGIAHIAAVG